MLTVQQFLHMVEEIAPPKAAPVWVRGEEPIDRQLSRYMQKIYQEDTEGNDELALPVIYNIYMINGQSIMVDRPRQVCRTLALCKDLVSCVEVIFDNGQARTISI